MSITFSPQEFQDLQEAIHKARYSSNYPENMIIPFDKEDQLGKEYCERLALAVVKFLEKKQETDVSLRDDKKEDSFEGPIIRYLNVMGKRQLIFTLPDDGRWNIVLKETIEDCKKTISLNEFNTLVNSLRHGLTQTPIGNLPVSYNKTVNLLKDLLDSIHYEVVEDAFCASVGDDT